MAVFKLLLICVLISGVFTEKNNDEPQSEVELQTRGEDRYGARLANLEAQLKVLLLQQKIASRGRDGRDGMPGRSGKDGKDGRDGATGRQGPPGPRGNPGKGGAAGPPGPAGGGVQYFRWGRTVCPRGAQLLYKGRMAGNFYYHKGGGTNYLCLKEKPKWLHYKDGYQIYASGIYRTEYETHQFGKLLFGKNLQNYDAPCASCYVPTRPAKMMLPGSYECPAGWSREYFGYIMAEHHNHRSSSTYVCVDRHAEPVPGKSSKKNLNGALLYPIQAMFSCSRSPCPYVYGRELTCAVCTK